MRGSRRRMLIVLVGLLFAEVLAWLSIVSGIAKLTGIGLLFWALVLTVAALLLLFCWVFPRALIRRHFRFSLMEILLTTLVFGAGLGWLIRLREQPRVHSVSKLERLGAIIGYGGSDAAGLQRLFRNKYFRDPKDVYLEYSPASADDLVALEGLPYLENLALFGPAITDTHLAHLRGLRSLKRLGLIGTGVSGKGFVHLQELPSLECLTLCGSTTSLEGIGILSKFPRLKYLNLNKTPVTDEDLVELGQITGLEFLGLDQTQVTDSGFVHLKDCQNLKGLALACTMITDEGLLQLRALTALQRLRLDGCALSVEAMRKLQRALPSTVISHERLETATASDEEVASEVTPTDVQPHR